MGTPLISDKELKKAVKEMQKIPQGMDKAAARALNDGLVVMGKVAARETSKEYVISQKDVKATFKKRKAYAGNLNAKIISTGSVIRLSKFPYSPKVTVNKRNKNGKLSAKSVVKVRIKRSEGKKVIHTTPPAFANTGEIWKRKGKNRFPREILYTLAVPSMIKNDNVKEPALEKGSERAQERLEHHLNHILGGGK